MKVIDPESSGLDVDSQPMAEAVAPGVFAIVQLDGSWGLSNAMLVVRDDRSLLVDTFFTERRNLRLRELVAERTVGPPEFLVNTHHHGDHVHGNGLFPEALVMAHRDSREAIAALDPHVSARRFAEVDFGATCPRVPDLTYDESATLHLGTARDPLTVRAIYPGIAHCPGNSVVHVVERGVLAAGDLLLKDCTPTFVGGSAIGFRSVLEHLRLLNASVVVPGHGPVCGPEVIEETERYVDFVLDLARHALGAGTSPLEAARDTALGEFASWHDAERLVGNLYRAMSELTDGRPFDVKQMWADTVTYLGHPVRSRA